MPDHDLAGEENLALQAYHHDGLIQRDLHSRRALHQTVFCCFHRDYGLPLGNRHDLHGIRQQVRVFLRDDHQGHHAEFVGDDAGFLREDVEDGWGSGEIGDRGVGAVGTERVAVSAKGAVVGGVVPHDVEVRVEEVGLC